MLKSENEKKPVACINCLHYRVTWDSRRPYGCQAHGFKTHRNPSLVVYESSGLECQLFEQKKSGY